MKQKQIRQGDILLQPIPAPKILKNVEKRENGRLILARGEATGHHHSIASKRANIFALENNLRVLQLEDTAVLEHQEHAPIELPSGTYQIIQQRENTALGWRTVLD